MSAVFANCVSPCTAPPLSGPAAGRKATLRDVQNGSCSFATLAHIAAHFACADNNIILIHRTRKPSTVASGRSILQSY